MRILILNQPRQPYLCYSKSFHCSNIGCSVVSYVCLPFQKKPQKVTRCNILLDCLKLEDHFNKLMQCYSIYFHLELIYPTLKKMSWIENHILKITFCGPPAVQSWHTRGPQPTL